jgi:molybdate transport system substrate-binding protein
VNGRCLALACTLAVVATSARADLVVGAAASLREPMRAIADRFETRFPDADVVISFGASSALARQIRAGAPIDVFASADPQISARLAGDRLLVGRSTRTIAQNRLVVIQTADLDPPLRQPADLARTGIRRIALPELAVPVGRYARDWLREAGLLAHVAARTVQTDHALATLRAVDAGLADAAIVYATDARLARSARVAFEIPDHEQPEIRYVASVVQDSANPTTAAQFVDFLRSPAATAVLSAAGFATMRDETLESAR